MPAPAAEFHDIQGLLKSAYGGLTEACYLLLRVTDRTAARAWLAAASVTTAADTHAAAVLQVALSAEGMRALGVAETVMAGFSAEFLSGITGEAGRSRRLGDVGANAPAQWRWGDRTIPHVLVILCAERDLSACRDRLTRGNFWKGFELIEELATSNMHGKEAFGFTDGVSQPQPDWHEQRRPGTTADLEYTNLIAVGEFLLGYRNEYGLYTDRPLLDPGMDGARSLPEAEDDHTKRDLGRNGSYLVFRELRQDVRGFWRYAAEIAGDAIRAVALAEVFVGRQISGDALIPGTHAIRGIGQTAADIRKNGFTYDDDKDGLRCPFGAHVRRANPRTADLPGSRRGWIARMIAMLGLFHPDLRSDLIAASRFHRILRRGREFGVALRPEDAMRTDAPDPRAGLHFICLNANISRQFEFIQNAWVMSAKFAGLSGESDPLLGNREELPPGEATDGFALPQPNGVTRRLAAVPQFVTVAGGGYFFLPGVRALRYLAGAGSGG